MEASEAGQVPMHCPLRRFPEFRTNFPSLGETDEHKYVLRHEHATAEPQEFRSLLYSRSRATFDPHLCEYVPEDTLEAELNYEGRTDLPPETLADTIVRNGALQLANLSRTTADNRVLEALNQFCPALRELYLAECPLAGSEELAALVRGAVALERLRVASCPGAWVAAGAECEHVTDSGAPAGHVAGAEGSGADEPADVASEAEPSPMPDAPSEPEVHVADETKDGGEGHSTQGGAPSLPLDVAFFQTVAVADCPLLSLDLSYNPTLRDEHFHAMSPDGSEPPATLLQYLVEFGAEDQRRAVAYEHDCRSTSVAIRKARAARQKQVLERRKRAKDNETSPSQRRKGDEAAPEEPDVVIPSMPKLEPPDMANFALTALANPWPMTEAAAQEKRKVEALGRIALTRVDIPVLRYTGPGCGALYSLTELFLAGCTALSDRTLVVVARMCPNLRLLSLAGCSQPTLTSGGLAYVALHCGQLEDVRLSGCSQLTSTAVLALAENCSKLQRLAICNLVMLEDAAVAALASRCPGLTDLDLSSCPKISDQALASLGSRSRALTLLNLNMCPAVTDKGLVVLQAALPRLRVIRHRSAPADPRTAGMVPGWKPSPAGETAGGRRRAAPARKRK